MRFAGFGCGYPAFCLTRVKYTCRYYDMSFTDVNTTAHAGESEAEPTAPLDTVPGWGRVLLLVGALGPMAFVALVVIGGVVTDGYSHSSQAISELAASGAEHAGLQTVAFVVVGVGVCCFAVGLHVVGRAPVVPTALVAVFGVLSALVGAALPCDEGCEPTTAIGTAHIIAGTTGFVAVLVAMFILIRHWGRSEPYTSLARPTRFLAWGGLAGLLAFNVTRGAELDSIDGLAQRAFALCVITWIVLTAMTLRRLTRAA